MENKVSPREKDAARRQMVLDQLTPTFAELGFVQIGNWEWAQSTPDAVAPVTLTFKAMRDDEDAQTAQELADEYTQAREIAKANAAAKAAETAKKVAKRQAKNAAKNDTDTNAD